MKTITFAVLITLLTTPLVHAADKPTVRVQITEADVSPELVPAVTDALNDETHRDSRLLALAHDAALQGRTLVITKGVQVLDHPRSSGEFPLPNLLKFPLQNIARANLSVPVADSTLPAAVLSDSRAQYTTSQSLKVASCLSHEGTVAVQYELNERRKALQGENTSVLGPSCTLSIGNSKTFHSGETKTVLLPTVGHNISHLFAVTVTILPPSKE